MVDTTRLSLRVSTDSDAGPYIRLPLDQLEGLRQRLDAHSVPYRVRETAVSIDGKPYVIVVQLGRTVDAAAVQVILDRGA